MSASDNGAQAACTHRPPCVHSIDDFLHFVDFSQIVQGKSTLRAIAENTDSTNELGVLYTHTMTRERDRQSVLYSRLCDRNAEE